MFSVREADGSAVPNAQNIRIRILCSALSFLCFCRPFHGLAFETRCVPSTEVLGYSRSSASRDSSEICQRKILNSRNDVVELHILTLLRSPIEKLDNAIPDLLANRDT